MNEKYMKEAIKEAKKAYKKDEVPIGAVIVKDNKIIARAHNLKEKKQMVTSHAEIEAIHKAAKKLGTWHLEECDLYVTLEPCPMCAGAIQQSRMQHVYFGAYDPKGGAIESIVRLYEAKGFNHYPYTTGGVLDEECAQLLKDYFKEKREKKKQEKLIAMEKNNG